MTHLFGDRYQLMGGVGQGCVLSPTFYYIFNKHIFISCICLVIIIQSFRKIHAWAEMKDALST